MFKFQGYKDKGRKKVMKKTIGWKKINGSVILLLSAYY